MPSQFSGENKADNMERDSVKRKREEPNVALPPAKKTKGECNRTCLPNLGDKKRKAADDGQNPSKRSKPSIKTPTEPRAEESNKRKRDAEDISEVPQKRRNSRRRSCSRTRGNCRRSTFNGSRSRSRSRSRGNRSPSRCNGRRSRSRDNCSPRCSYVHGRCYRSRSRGYNSNRCSPRRRCSPGRYSPSRNRIFGHTRRCHPSAEEEMIYWFASSAKTSRADFQRNYQELNPIGQGGFGSVYGGFRRCDSLPIAIKHIPIARVQRERVCHNGRVHNVILEVALMLRAGGLSGTVGQSAAVSLLDWYILNNELILVMESPQPCKDLMDYINDHGGFLTEQKAMNILKQLVDILIDLQSKGIFHSDIKPENILIQEVAGETRVRLIDFGCGSFIGDKPYNYFSGTRIFAPPEWFLAGRYRAEPATVWQLGALFFSLLWGHDYFTTSAYVLGKIKINRHRSRRCKTLLSMCLMTKLSDRASLEELQRHLNF